MFSRNVFCGATSPRRPPAMVILPTARALGVSGAASHRSRRPDTQPSKVPSSPRPMRPAATERRGGGPAAALAALRTSPLRPAGLCARVPRAWCAAAASRGRREPAGPGRPLPSAHPAGTQSQPGAAGQGWDCSGTLWAQREVCPECAWGWVLSKLSSFLGEVTPEKVTRSLRNRRVRLFLCAASDRSQDLQALQTAFCVLQVFLACLSSFPRNQPSV